MSGVQDERLRDGDVVELLCPDPDQHAELGEEEPDEEQRGEQNQDVLHRQVDQERRGGDREGGDHKAAHEPSEREREQQLERRRRRGELVLDRPLELLLEDR